MQEHTKTLYRLETKQDQTNGRLTKLEADALVMVGVERERAKWEERQATNLKWLFMAGLAAAGTMSGIIFGVIQLAFSDSPVVERVVPSPEEPATLHPDFLCDVPPCRGHQPLGGVQE